MADTALATETRIEAPEIRRAVIEISPEVIVALCKGTEPTTIRVAENALPADARCVGANYDALRDVWRLAIESETFSPVIEGCHLPVLRPPVFVRLTQVTDG